MDKRKHKRKSPEGSGYTQLGYTGLHIKPQTRDRLNLIVAHMKLTTQKFVSQDDAINLLLDQYDITKLPQPVEAA